jgi:NADH-quinone oxidoreductase subunit G
MVDGKEVVAKPGTNMIEAAKVAGADIPYYCYHPRLTIAANCRMCLVEVSNAPKLVPACQTALVEGMAITTQSARVQESQRSVMEFLLLNHPVDCAICDQAGECKLQDYYMRYSFRPSRLEGRKVLKEKRKVLGPLVVIDQERCILCTRCVRFMAEVAKEPQLGVFGRGSAEVVDVFPGSEMTSNYSGNTVDICPVGALLNRDFRFRARTWFLSAAPSVCTGCSRGCNIFVDFMGQDTYRYRPRENEAVNQNWMCDQGRLSYKYLNQKRVLTSSMGRGADVREVTRGEALEGAFKLLKPVLGSSGLAVLASPLASNEDLLAGLQLAKSTLGVKEVYAGGRPEGAGDALLMTMDKNPNRKGLEWIAAGLGLTLRPFADLLKGLESGAVRALYAIGAEIPAEPERTAAALSRLEVFVAQAINESAITAQAHVLFPSASHVEGEGSFVNTDGRIQRFRQVYPPLEQSQPHWRWAEDVGKVLAGTEVHASARELFKALSQSVKELAAFNWDAEAPALLRQGITPLAAGADGRPPGYREVGVPRVEGI